MNTQMQPDRIFSNIFEAMQCISALEENAWRLPMIMPPVLAAGDPCVAAGANLDKDDFLVTRLMCNRDDVAYYRMLAIEDRIPYLTDFRRFSLKPNLGIFRK